MRTPAPVLIPLCLAAAEGPCSPVLDSAQTPYYAQTTWASVHGDSRNSDHVPIVTPASCEVTWTALDGAATLLAPSIGPEGNRYVTTGRGRGTAHLHAFDRDGRLLWESPRCFSDADLDAWAVLSGPVVDCDGDLYVSDSDQFWAFRSGGSIKWVADLAALGATNGFISAIITREGYVGGITTDGLVILLERADGRLALPVLELPGGAGPPGPATPPWGLWGGGLIEPSRVATIYYAFFGFRVEVANTPAVHPATGRIYVTAAGSTPALGVLYGIDVAQTGLSIAFAAPMAGGSGSSPDISPDGSRVYAADGNGVMHAFDAGSGALLWSRPGVGTAASPGVGPDGTIYSGSGAGLDGVLTALDPDGGVKWRVNYDGLAAAYLAPLPPLPPFFETGLPTAKVNSVVTTSARDVWVVLALGYDVTALDGSQAHQPRVAVLASIDPADGSVLHTLALRDTSEGVISIGPDGSLYVSHAAMQSSVFYRFLNLLLPPAYHVPGPPLAGLTAVGSVSPRDHAVLGVEWAQELAAGVLAGPATGSTAAAGAALRRASFQCGATLYGVGDAAVDGEIGAFAAAAARGHLERARELFREAARVLEPPGSWTQASAKIAEALARLAAARLALQGS